MVGPTQRVQRSWFGSGFLTSALLVVSCVCGGLWTDLAAASPTEGQGVEQAAAEGGSAEKAEVAAAAPSKSGLPDLSWVPPPDDFDWIQLKSGEWLKGRIKAMQDDELEFDSDKLDVLTFDWSDIRQLRSARRLDLMVQQWGTDDEKGDSRTRTKRGLFGRKLPELGEELSGIVTITPDEVRVVDGVVHTVVPRSRLQSLTPGGSREIDYWSGNASVGLTLRSGNQDQVDYSALLHLQRRTPSTRLKLDYVGNVSRTADFESANDHRVNAEFDLWLSGRFYLILPWAEYYRDPFQNIESRVTAGGGLGYDLIDTSDVEWTISAGPGQQWVEYTSAQPGEPTETESASLTVNSRFDWDITKDLELAVIYRGQLTKEEVGETTHHFTSTLSIDLTKSVDLDISFIWDRTSQPKADEDGVVPEPDDYRLVFGFGMDF